MIMDRRILYLSVSAGVLAAIAVGLWLLLAQEEPAVVRVSAAHALQQACDAMAEQNYDAVKVSTADSGKVSFTFAFSGSDFRADAVIYHADGETVAAKSEYVIKDGVWYARESASLDDPDTLGDWSIWQTGLDPDLAVPCFGEDSSEAIRSATVESSPSSSERRIVWKTESDGRTTTQHVLWVDSTGRPTRGRITVTQPSEENQPSEAAGGASSAGTSQLTPVPKVIVQVEETYSGFGEPNIIAAPIATPKPTSTYEPWPTPTPRTAPDGP